MGPLCRLFWSDESFWFYYANLLGETNWSTAQGVQHPFWVQCFGCHHQLHHNFWVNCADLHRTGRINRPFGREKLVHKKRVVLLGFFMFWSVLNRLLSFAVKIGQSYQKIRFYANIILLWLFFAIFDCFRGHLSITLFS